MRRTFPSKVQSLLDMAANSIQDSNGYSYALNTVLVEFLEKIDTSLKTPSQNLAPVAAPRLSPTRKKQLSSLVKILFSVLEKSKCEIDELSNPSQNQSSDNPTDILIAALTKILGVNINKKIVNEIIQSVPLTLAEALETLLQEDNLHQMTYRFIHLLNDCYIPNSKSRGPCRGKR